MRRPRASITRLCVLVLGAGLALSACATGGDGGGSDGGGEEAQGCPTDRTEQSGEADEVVLLTHDSFSLPDKLINRFESETGQTLEQRATGDAGELTNGLVLSAGNPQGDVVFGVDNTFASRAVDECVFSSYAPELPEGAEDHELPGDEMDALTPIDTGSVCVNIDETWFANNDVEPPETLEDLTEPEYQGLFVLPGATTSSPGLAFLLATIDEYGDDWPEYWERLLGNGAKLTSGWSDAYYVEFTQGGENGQRPIVLSYDSSPAFTVNDRGESTTAALLDTCYRQVEYAGVLAGTDNPEGAQAVVDFLLSPEVQAALPESMFVYPVDEGVELPADWAEHAERAEETYQLDPEEVANNRQEWLTEWTEIVGR